MVNESEQDPKRVLLEILRDSSAPLSGETLGAALGISRVAVHKHVRTLREYGYRIESEHRGYHIEETEIPLLTSWEFAERENITVLRETASTMDKAHSLESGPRRDDFIVAALRQTRGRGRRERTWMSPEGGLWVTRVIHPKGSALRIQRYVMAAAAGLVRLLRDRYGIPADVKWPNDVLVSGKKIAGVLGEAEISGDLIRYAALGLGVNANNGPADGTVSMKALLGREVDRSTLLKEWIGAMDILTSSEDFRLDGTPRWWNSLMTGKGEKAAYFVDSLRISGTVVGADGLGRLRLRGPDGSVRRIGAGDIE